MCVLSIKVPIRKKSGNLFVYYNEIENFCTVHLQSSIFEFSWCLNGIFSVSY